MGIVEDENQKGYAVAYNDAVDEFIVTNEMGVLLEDDQLAQEILDDFRVFSEEAAPSEEPES